MVVSSLRTVRRASNRAREHREHHTYARAHARQRADTFDFNRTFYPMNASAESAHDAHEIKFLRRPVDTLRLGLSAARDVGASTTKHPVQVMQEEVRVAT